MLSNYLFSEPLLPLCHSISSTTEFSKKRVVLTPLGNKSSAVTQGTCERFERSLEQSGVAGGEFLLLESLAAGTGVSGPGNLRVRSTRPTPEEQPLPLRHSPLPLSLQNTPGLVQNVMGQVCPASVLQQNRSGDKVHGGCEWIQPLLPFPLSLHIHFSISTPLCGTWEPGTSDQSEALLEAATHGERRAHSSSSLFSRIEPG